MGCCMSKTSGPLLSISVPLDVTSVPADVVWQVVTDIDHLPDIVETVVGMERLTPARITRGDSNNTNNSKNEKLNGSILQVGTRWRETRRFPHRAKEIVQIKTVIQLQQDEYPKSMSLNVSYPHAKDFINTSTLTVTPLEDGAINNPKTNDDGCVLIGSMSFMTDAPLFNACCLNSRRAKQHATLLFTKELQDYAHAAKLRLDKAPKSRDTIPEVVVSSSYR